MITTAREKIRERMVDAIKSTKIIKKTLAPFALLILEGLVVNAAVRHELNLCASVLFPINNSLNVLFAGLPTNRL